MLCDTGFLFIQTFSLILVFFHKLTLYTHTKGGLAYDLVLAEHFATEIDARPDRKGQPSIRTNQKAMLKLMKECNRLKETLSANKEVQFSVENIYDGNDFRSKMTRELFERLASDLL